jgi:hypothetical protein
MHTTLCLPVGSCARLKDRTVNGRAAGSSGASGGFTEGISAERPDPWHRKPHQRGGLKRKAKTECGLIGSYRIMSVLRRPLLAQPKCRRFRAPLARAANSFGK